MGFFIFSKKLQFYLQFEERNKKPKNLLRQGFMFVKPTVPDQRPKGVNPVPATKTVLTL